MGGGKAPADSVEVGGSSGIVETESGGLPAPATRWHDANNRFAVGNPGGGRKPKATERAYLDAIKAALPPEDIAALLKEALEMARATNSWRGMAEVIGIALQYGAGKPTQRVVSSDGNLEQILALLGDDVKPGEAGKGEDREGGDAQRSEAERNA